MFSDNAEIVKVHPNSGGHFQIIKIKMYKNHHDHKTLKERPTSQPTIDKQQFQKGKLMKLNSLIITLMMHHLDFCPETETDTKQN